MTVERMTDEEFDAGLERFNYGSEAKRFAATEARRARSEEARLLEDNRKQAETIKALADALDGARVAMHRGEFGDKGRDWHVPEQVDAALRLVGRIK